MVHDIRVSRAICAADVSAFGASLCRRVEQCATAVAVPPHTLNRLPQNQILSLCSRRLRYLEAILLGLLNDHIDWGIVAIDFLRREPGAFAAALVAATATDLLGPEVLIAFVALTVHADSNLLRDPIYSRADLSIHGNYCGVDTWRCNCRLLLRCTS